MSLRHQLGLLLLGFLASCTYGQSSRTARIDNYGEAAMMTCTERADVTFKYWLLPDLRMLDRTNNPDDRMKLMSNFSIYIPSVEREHLGDYICMVEDFSDAPLFYKTNLFLYIPGLWETYRQNVIVGCSAAAIFLVLMSVTCAFSDYHFNKRQRAKAAEYQEQTGGEHQNGMVDMGMDNKGFNEVKYNVAGDGPVIVNTNTFITKDTTPL